MLTHYYNSIAMNYWSRYCCDPFKSHWCHVSSYLRVVPASLTAEHPSFSLQSGVLACCNCFKAILECCPESGAPSTLSENCDDDSNAVPDLLKLNETLSSHVNVMSHKK